MAKTEKAEQGHKYFMKLFLKAKNFSDCLKLIKIVRETSPELDNHLEPVFLKSCDFVTNHEEALRLLQEAGYTGKRKLTSIANRIVNHYDEKFKQKKERSILSWIASIFHKSHSQKG